MYLGGRGHFFRAGLHSEAQMKTLSISFALRGFFFFLLTRVKPNDMSEIHSIYYVLSKVMKAVTN